VQIIITETAPSRNPKYRWHFPIGFAIVFSIVGLALGWSIDTNHPDDRLADIFIPTLAFLTIGFQLGYTISLVIHRRFNWFDAVASFALLPMLLAGFVFAKSGDWTTGRAFGYASLGVLVFLIARFIYASNKPLKSSNV